jgi:hypothetical protein
MKFLSGLDVPRSGDTTSIPMSWVRDDTISHEARGVLVTLLSLVHPGVEVDEDEVQAARKPEDPPLRMLTPELCRAGYLEWRGGTPDRRGPRYALVHPERLGPLAGRTAP